MSPKHQPIPRKRLIDQVTPEFPPLPRIPLEATMDFAIKSQEALVSVQQKLSLVNATFPRQHFNISSSHIASTVTA